MEKSFVTASFADLDSVTMSLVPVLPRKCVILLSGPLGAGKTHFVKSLLKALGAQEDSVTSPTFTFHHSYDLSNLHVDHFDLYRIENDADLESIGFWDVFLRVADAWVIIEWPEKMKISELPPHWPQVLIDIQLVANRENESAAYVVDMSKEACRRIRVRI